MGIRFEVPGFIEQALRSMGDDPSQVVKELFLVDLYRKEQITHHELARTMGLGRCKTDGLLKRHDVDYGLTLEEHQARVESLRRLLDENRP
jgi:hypothetical protein